MGSDIGQNSDGRSTQKDRDGFYRIDVSYAKARKNRWIICFFIAPKQEMLW